MVRCGLPHSLCRNDSSGERNRYERHVMISSLALRNLKIVILSGHGSEQSCETP